MEAFWPTSVTHLLKCWPCIITQFVRIYSCHNETLLTKLTTSLHSLFNHQNIWADDYSFPNRTLQKNSLQDLWYKFSRKCQHLNRGLSNRFNDTSVSFYGSYQSGTTLMKIYNGKNKFLSRESEDWGWEVLYSSVSAH